MFDFNRYGLGLEFKLPQLPAHIFRLSQHIPAQYRLVAGIYSQGLFAADGLVLRYRADRRRIDTRGKFGKSLSELAQPSDQRCFGKRVDMAEPADSHCLQLFMRHGAYTGHFPDGEVFDESTDFRFREYH